MMKKRSPADAYVTRDLRQLNLRPEVLDELFNQQSRIPELAHFIKR